MWGTPRLSRTLTIVPASVVGSGSVDAASVEVASDNPKAAAIASLASAGVKLAAETLATTLLLFARQLLSRTVTPPL